MHRNDTIEGNDANDGVIITNYIRALHAASELDDMQVKKDAINKILSEIPSHLINKISDNTDPPINILGYFCGQANLTIVVALLVKFKEGLDLQTNAVEIGEDGQVSRVSTLDLATRIDSDDARKIANLLFSRGVELTYDILLNALASNHPDIYTPFIKSLQIDAQTNAYPAEFLQMMTTAIENGMPEVIKNAINAGIDPDMLINVNDSLTLLHLLCAYPDFCDPVAAPDLIQFLIEKGADVNSKSVLNTTPLLCCSYHSTPICNCFRSKQEHNCNELEIEQRCYSVKSKLMEILIENGADIDCVDNEMRTPLYIALCNRDYDNAILMINKAIEDDNNNNKKVSIDFKRVLKDNFSYLILAVADNGLIPDDRYNFIELLINVGCNLDNMNVEGYAALHIAAQNNDELVLKLLIKSNANINVESEQQGTPLYAAVKHGAKQCAFALIEKGATISEAIIQEAVQLKNLSILIALFKKIKSQANTDIHILSIFDEFFIQCCESGKIAEIKAFIDAGYDINGGNSADLPLLVVSAGNQVDVVKCLLESGANRYILNSKDESPLSIAFAAKHDAIIRHLLSNEENRQFRFACQNNHFDLAKYLAKYIDFREISEADQLALEYIFDLDESLETEIIVKKLLKFDHLNTFIVRLCRFGKVSILQRLVEMQCLQNVINKLIEGKTLLCYACEGNQAEVVEFLLANGAEVNKCNSDLEQRNTPLHIVASNGNAEIITLLLEHGAKPAKLNTAKEAPSTVATRNDHYLAAGMIEDFEHSQTMSPSKFNQLKLSCESGDKIFLEKVTNVNASHYEDNQNLLHKLCDSDSPLPVIIQILIDKHGFDINERDLSYEGYNALHLAIRKGNTKLVEVLIKKQADVNKRTVQNGLCPLQLACECYNNKSNKLEIYAGIIRILIQNNAHIPPELISSESKESPAKKFLLKILDENKNNNLNNNNLTTNPEVENTSTTVKPYSPRYFQPASRIDTSPTLNCSWANGSLDSAMADIYISCQQESILCNYCSPELRQQLGDRYELFKTLIENPSKAIKLGQTGIKILKGLEHKVGKFDIGGQIVTAAPTRELKQLHGNNEDRLIGIIIPADNTEFFNGKPVKKASLIIWYLDVPDLHVGLNVKSIKDSISARAKHDTVRKISVPKKTTPENLMADQTTAACPKPTKKSAKKKRGKAETNSSQSPTPTLTPALKNG